MLQLCIAKCTIVKLKLFMLQLDNLDIYMWFNLFHHFSYVLSADVRPWGPLWPRWRLRCLTSSDGVDTVSSHTAKSGIREKGRTLIEWEVEPRGKRLLREIQWICQMEEEEKENPQKPKEITAWYKGEGDSFIHVHTANISECARKNISISNGKSPKQRCLQGGGGSEKSCLSLCVTYQPKEKTFFFFFFCW